MCGIAGIISNGRDFSDALGLMLKSQHHRGPDYTGIFEQERICYLGHNRLKIIDLTDTANQPFISQDQNYVVVFNGEIYNYIELKEEIGSNYNFITKSDTEVLLAAYILWGENCLNRLKGMFSFAIWNKKERSLFAARDRFGVKPFHYTVLDGVLVFSSEIKAIHATKLVPKVMNEKVWAGYLTYATYGMPDETFWNGIQQLPGGHSLKYSNGNLKIQKWYNFTDNVSRRVWDKSEVEIIDELELKLKETIQYRLRSDVKTGFNLSGGVDSTLLFSLIRQYLNPENTSAFTFYSDNKDYDELEWVEQILKGSAFTWQKCLINKNSIPEYAKKIQHHQDEPYAGIATLAYARVFEDAKLAGYTVLLDGSGMDEQIAGYDYYTKTEEILIQGSNTSPLRPIGLIDDFRNLAQKPEFPQPFDNRIQNLQYRDIFYTKLPRDLRMTDRISMAFSTEMREPFMDHELMEMSFSLPENYKIRDGKRKWIMRKILSRYLSGTLLEAPKRPIQTPQREWLSKDLKEWVVSTIDIAIKKHPFLNRGEIEKELSKLFDGENENTFFIWQWITLGLID